MDALTRMASWNVELYEVVRGTMEEVETIAHLPSYLPSPIAPASSSFPSFSHTLSSPFSPPFEYRGSADDDGTVSPHESKYGSISPQSSPPPTPLFQSPQPYHRTRLTSSHRSPLQSVPSTPPSSRKSSIADTPDVLDAASEAASRAPGKLGNKMSLGFDPVVRTIESVEVAEEEPEQESGVDDDEGVLLSRMASFQLGMQVEEEDEINKLLKACDGRAITGTSRRLLGSSSSIRLLRNVAASGLSYPCPSPFAPLQPVRPVSPTSYAFIDRTRPLSLPPSSPPSPIGAPHSTTRPRPTLSQTTTYTSQGFLLPCQAERNSSHPELAHHKRSKDAATAVDSSFERIRDWRQVVASREMPECDLDRVSAKLREISSLENSLASVGRKGLQRSQTLADLRSQAIQTPQPLRPVPFGTDFVVDRRTRSGTPPPGFARASKPNLRHKASTAELHNSSATISPITNRGPSVAIRRNARSA